MPDYRRAVGTDREPVLRALECANFHHIPSKEMPELEIERFFVAEDLGTIVGVAGFKVTTDGTGKTTLMAVEPAWRGRGVGERLQALRMTAMRELGCKVAITNADRPATIAWYKRKFGYVEVGSVPKFHEFGDPSVHHWTTLEVDLRAWGRPAQPFRNEADL